MSIFQKPNRHQVIVTTCVLIWIFIVNVAAIALGVTGWPLYFVTIFFFALGADMKNVPSIFAGGTLGLIAALGLHAGTFGLAPSLGLLGAFSVSIAIVLAVIILGGTVCPVACNNVAFAYLTVATVNFEAITPAVVPGAAFCRAGRIVNFRAGCYNKSNHLIKGASDDVHQESCQEQRQPAGV